MNKDFCNLVLHINSEVGYSNFPTHTHPLHPRSSLAFTFFCLPLSSVLFPLLLALLALLSTRPGSVGACSRRVALQSLMESKMQRRSKTNMKIMMLKSQAESTLRAKTSMTHLPVSSEPGDLACSRGKKQLYIEIKCFWPTTRLLKQTQTLNSWL